MMNKIDKKEYNNALVGWLRSILKERYEIEKSTYQTFENYLTFSFYLVTMAFNQSDIVEKYKSEDREYAVGEVELKQFRHLYNLICRRLLDESTISQWMFKSL